MNRPITALFAALEALLVGGLGIGVLLVPLTALWAFQYDLQIGWPVFYRVAADAWLLGHGVDIRFVLDARVAGALGLPAAGTPFVVGIGALGGALLTAVLAARTGARLSRTEHPVLGALAAVGCFAVLAFLVVLTAGTTAAQPSRWQGVLLPTAVFAGGAAAGWLLRRRSSPDQSPAGRRIPRIPVVVREAVRIGLGAGASILAVAAVAVAALLVVRYSTVISLYESLQAGPLGGAALTVAQLALLPDLVIWAAAWLVGPGFALGAGSSVSPLGTSVGPVPALPILGAVPPGDFAWGFLGLLVPVVIAFVLGSLLRQRVDRALLLPPSLGALAAVGGGAGAAAGLALAVAAAGASGAAGPGRLSQVGADPLLVGLLAAVEVAIGATLGLLAARRRAPAGEPFRGSLHEEALR